MIDLSPYTPNKRRHLKVQGFSCLYVIAPEATGPSKIGYAFDIVDRLNSMQPGNWVGLSVWYVLWTPGKPVSTRLEGKCHEFLKAAGKHVRGEWFNIPAEWAQKTIEVMARKYYPGATLYGHQQMIDKLKAKLLDRKDWVYRPETAEDVAIDGMISDLCLTLSRISS